MIQYRDFVIKRIQSKSGIINAQEFFGARDSQPLATCLEEVERSQVFLLFLSPRLGSIDNESGKSFVEREYDKACELGILKLAYIMDEDYEYPIKYVSKDADANQLAIFKKRVMEELTVSRYTTPDDLASKVYEDLKRELPRSGFSIGIEDESDETESVIGEPKRASESQCQALSLKRGEALVCVIEADDKAISDLLLDSKVVLFAEGKAAESLLDVKPGNMVIVEAQTAYGIIRVKTPYYGFQYETGAFDSMVSMLAGRQRVITGYEENKEELLGLYLKEVRLA